MIASWGIYNQKGEQRFLLPYSDIGVSEALLTKLNEKSETVDFNQPYYLQMTKREFHNIPRQIVEVRPELRKVRGTSEDKITGEKRLWSKEFHDITVTSLIDGRHQITEVIVCHFYKSKLRVKYKDESHDRESFIQIAKENWPEHYGFVTTHLEW